MELISTSTVDRTDEHNKLSKEFEKIQTEITDIEKVIEEKNDKKKVVEMYERDLRKAPKKLIEFDKVLFVMLVDKIVVHTDRLEMVWKANL